MTDRFDGALIAGVRYVRSAEGARRFKVPVGSRIETDAHGNVVRINGKAASLKAPPAHQVVKKIDPSRLPKKFIATVPGQKAKLELNIPTAPGAQHGTIKLGAPAGRSIANGNVMLSRDEITAVSRSKELKKLLGGESSAETRVLRKMTQHKKLTPNETRLAARALERAIKKLDHQINGSSKKSTSSSSSSSSKSKSSAKSKSSSSSSKSSSSGTHAHHAYSDSAWLSSLQSALSTLRAASKGTRGPDTGGAQKTASSPKKHVPNSFNGLTDAELSSAIRGLSRNKTQMGKSALARAEQVRDERARRKKLQERMTKL